MNKAELQELLANGENSGVEFQRDDLRPEQLAREIVALANFQGGRILLGVEDDGTVSGVQRENIEEWVMDTVLARYVHPFVTPYYEEVQWSDGHRVAVITVGPGVSKPYVVRERNREDIYIRIGSTCRRATREQQARLFALGGMLAAESLPVPGSGLDDLSQDRLKHYLASVVGDTALPVTDEAWKTRLTNLSFMADRSGGPAVCTFAGLLLFGYAPRRLLRHAGIRWMAFEGTEKDYKALDDRVFDGPFAPLRKTVAGNVQHMLEGGLLDRAMDAMRPFISEEAGALTNSLRRERRWLYPEEAVREALVNAIAHRDWTRTEEIEVVRYADRLEISSPGALTNSVTVEKMKAGFRSARNQLLVEALRDFGYVDARGMGVRNKIIPLLKEHNGTEPAFIATEDYLKVVMRLGRG